MAYARVEFILPAGFDRRPSFVWEWRHDRFGIVQPAHEADYRNIPATRCKHDATSKDDNDESELRGKRPVTALNALRPAFLLLLTFRHDG
jgi:hypothetical protein